MIDDVRQRLAQQGQVVAPRVLMSGFSASGSFVNRFAFLHPDRVLALASGSPGGWPLAPVAQVDGVSLNYPVGVADLERLSGERPQPKALKALAAFIYMGDQDENDAVVHRDSFSSEDERLIFAKFGATPMARWQRSQQLYASQGLDARFVLYPGAAHSVTPQMQADIAAFFEQRLAAAGR
jgi:dienelactone hydrolase